MPSHPAPTFLGCADDMPMLGCSDHFRNDETRSFFLDSTISSSVPFVPGDGTIIEGNNHYKFRVDASGSYVTSSRAACKRRGWFGFSAGMYWNGRYGFEYPNGCFQTTYYTTSSICVCPATIADAISSGDPCGCWNCRFSCGSDPDCYDGNCYIPIGQCCKKCRPDVVTLSISSSSCPVEPTHSNVTTKYLTITATGTMTHYSASVVLETVDLTYTATVDAFSSIVTGTSNYDSSSVGEYAFLQSWLTADMAEAANITCPSLYDSGSFDPSCPGYSTALTDGPDTLNPLSVCFLQQIAVPIIQNRWNWSDSAEVGHPSAFCAPLGSTMFGHSTMTHTDTVIAVSKTLTGEALSLDAGFSYVIDYTVTLSDPWTSDDVISNCKSLLAPWKFDELVDEWINGPVDFTAVPYSTYHMVDSGVSPMVGMFITTASYTDPNSGSYDGSVMGNPLPMTYTVPGSGSQLVKWGSFYNTKHHNYDIDTCLGLVPLFIRSNPPTGSYCTANRATEKWPDFVTLADGCGDNVPIPTMLTPVGFGYYSMPFQGNKITIVKYAEVGEFNRPSINFDRPFASGSHRDEKTRNAATQDCSAGSSYDITSSISGSLFLTDCGAITASFVKPCGDPLWTGLQTQSVNDYWNWEGKRYDFTDVNYTFNFRDYAEVDRYNNNVSGSCAGRDTNGFSLATVIRPGTRALQIVNSTQEFISYNGCMCNIMVISPNAVETMSRYNAKQYDLPIADCDDTYTSLTMRKPWQYVVDPFWYAPLKPCGTGSIPPATGCTTLNWSEEDGQIYPIDQTFIGPIYSDFSMCNPDIEDPTDSGCNNYRMYYPCRLFTEARTMPASDPCNVHASKSLDSKARKLGCSNYISYINSGHYTSSAANDPLNVCAYCETPHAYVESDIFRTSLSSGDLPWVISTLQETCVNDNGRFADVYKANGAGGNELII